MDSVSNISVSNHSYLGELDKVKECIAADSTCISKKDNDERVALHWAASGNKLDVCKLLIKSGAKINVEDEAGWTPLHVAVSSGSAPIVELFLKPPASDDGQPVEPADVDATNESGCTPLFYAISKNHSSLTNQLIEAKCDIFVKNKRGESPFLRAVARGNETTVRKLVSLGASVHDTDGFGNNALHLVCSENHALSLALFLIEKGVDLMQRNRDEKKPLALARPEFANAITATFPTE